MCSVIGPILFIIVNAVISVFGALVTVVAALASWNRPLLQKSLGAAANHLSKFLEENDQKYVDEAISRILENGYVISVTAFVFGVFVLVFSILGFVGVCCGSRILLTVYAGLVGAIILAHVVIIIVYFARKDLLINGIHKLANDSIANYQSVDSLDIDSIVAALIMQTFKCCGYENAYKEFANSTKFTRRDKIRDKVYEDIKYPVACCKGELEQEKEKCPQLFTSQNSYVGCGCKNRLDREMISRFDQAAYYSIIPLGIECLLLLLAVMARG